MAAGSSLRDGSWILERVGAETERLELRENREVTVGRGLGVTHRLTARNCPLMISRNHCAFRVTPEKHCIVIDNQSLNGVWVNGKRIEPQEAHPLKEGDVIQLGVPLHDTEQAEYQYRLAWRHKVLPHTVEELGVGSSTRRRECARVKRKHSHDETEPGDTETTSPVKNKLQRVCASHPSGTSTSREGQGGTAERRDPDTSREGQGGTAERRDPDTSREGQGGTAERRDPDTSREGQGGTAERRDPDTSREWQGGSTERRDPDTAERRDPDTSREGQGGTAERRDPDTSREGKGGTVADCVVPGTSWERKSSPHTPGRLRALTEVQGESAQAVHSGKSWQSKERCVQGLARQQEEQQRNLEGHQQASSHTEGQQRELQELEAALSQQRKELEDIIRTKDRELEESKINVQKVEAATQFADVLENELQCIICSEYFVEAVTLNCSHSFCCHCILEWRKRKDECPICRQRICSQARSIVLDSCIERMLESLNDSVREHRLQLINQRKALKPKSTCLTKSESSSFDDLTSIHSISSESSSDIEEPSDEGETEEDPVYYII